MHSRVPPDGITANVVIFDLGGLSVRQLFKFRRQYNGGLIGVYKDSPPAEIVRLLEFGIDDCIKITDERLLLARSKSLLTRAFLSGDTVTIEKKSWVFDRQTMVITPPAGKHLEISTGQAKLLGFLIEHEGQCATREQISECVYGEPWVYENRKIDMAIGTLRRKLLDADVDARIITISSKGYFLDLGDPNAIG